MALRKERNAQMRHTLAESALNYQTRFLGSVLPVLWESTAALDPQGWRMSGLTDNYLRVTAHGGQHLWNRIAPVRPTAEVDPTGCGDAYRAGLLYGIAQGFDWPTTGRLASLMGSIKISFQANSGVKTVGCPAPSVGHGELG